MITVEAQQDDGAWVRINGYSQWPTVEAAEDYIRFDRAVVCRLPWLLDVDRPQPRDLRVVEC